MTDFERRVSRERLRHTRNEAIDRINVAVGSTELNLQKCSLSHLPAELGASSELSDTLEVLNLGGNSLDSLPDWLAHFTRLRVLFLLGCSFSQMPAVVAALPSLYMLSFKSNRLASVPEHSLSPSIGWLILTDNRIS